MVSMHLWLSCPHGLILPHNEWLVKGALPFLCNLGTLECDGPVGRVEVGVWQVYYVPACRVQVYP